MRRARPAPDRHAAAPACPRVGARDPDVHPGGEQGLVARLDLDAVDLGLHRPTGEGLEECREAGGHVLTTQGTGRGTTSEPKATGSRLVGPLQRHEGTRPHEAAARHPSQALERSAVVS